MALFNSFVLSTVLVLVAAMIDYSYQDATYVRQAEMECMKEFPSISNDFLEAMKRSKEVSPNAPKNVKCFAHCVGTKLKITEGDAFAHDMIKQILQDVTGGAVSDAEADDITKKCGAIATHSDECEKTWEFVICAAEDLKDYRLHHTICDTC